MAYPSASFPVLHGYGLALPVLDDEEPPGELPIQLNRDVLLNHLEAMYTTFELGYMWGVVAHRYRSLPEDSFNENFGEYVDNVQRLGNLRLYARLHPHNFDLMSLSTNLITRHINNPLEIIEPVDLSPYRQVVHEEALTPEIIAAAAPEVADHVHENDSSYNLPYLCVIASLATCCVALFGIAAYMFYEDA